MIDLIVETDIGRDPDDFFALCYLIGCGKVHVRLITISPGDRDQVALAKLVLSETGLDIPVGVGKMDRNKSSVGGVHVEILQRYDFPRELDHDGYGPELVEQTLDQYPACEIFACGPLNSVGKFFKEHPEVDLGRATMQGGFCAYDVHDQEVVTLDKFIGKTTVATFNLNGDLKGARAFLEAQIEDRRFVGKNLCHTIVCDGDRHRQMSTARNRARALFLEGMNLYLDKHPDGKKFHDPLAAVAHLHPEIFTWVTGRLFRQRGGWGTEPAEDGDRIAIDVDRDAFWQHIANFTWQRREVEMAKRLIIGDIHGCWAELNDLLDAAGLAADDEIIAIGDIVDRGPDSPVVLEFFQETSNAQSLIGNHERKHVRSGRGEIRPALSQLIARRQIGEDHYEEACRFMESLPRFIELPEAILVHGFFEPGLPLADQRETVVVGTLSGEHYLAKQYDRPWYELYDSEKPVIVGHHDYLRTGQPLIRDDKVFGIDTGCCHGGRLTGLLLPEFRFVSVPSRHNYWTELQQQYADIRYSTTPNEDLTWEAVSTLVSSARRQTSLPPSIQERVSELQNMLIEAEQALDVSSGFGAYQNRGQNRPPSEARFSRFTRGPEMDEPSRKSREAHGFRGNELVCSASWNGPFQQVESWLIGSREIGSILDRDQHLEALFDHINQKHREIVADLRKELPFDTVDAKKQGSLYANRIGKTPLSRFLHQARRGQLDLEKLLGQFKKPSELVNFTRRVGVSLGLSETSTNDT